jgi:hypothetical protein
MGRLLLQVMIFMKRSDPGKGVRALVTNRPCRRNDEPLQAVQAF